MAKKIVIMPVFCEAHLIKYQIPNIIDTINPDYIIYNDGMFPRGPESSTNVNDDFVTQYTMDGHSSWDFWELDDIVKKANEKYPDTTIILNRMYYPDGCGAPECYYLACSNFKDFGIEIEEGDIIFPYEGDVFHHHDSGPEIQSYIDQLKPDSGFTSTWIDFIDNQYYAERSTLKPIIDKKEGRHRRIAIKYGTEKFYKDVLLNFMTQKYPMLYPTDLLTYHYCWWRPGKYKQLRYDQLNRPKKYWQDFDKGMREIREIGKGLAKGINYHPDVVVRPDRPVGMTARFGSYINIEHPRHVQDHENYIK